MHRVSSRTVSGYRSGSRRSVVEKPSPRRYPNHPSVTHPTANQPSLGIPGIRVTPASRKEIEALRTRALQTHDLPEVGVRKLLLLREDVREYRTESAAHQQPDQARDAATLSGEIERTLNDQRELLREATARRQTGERFNRRPPPEYVSLPFFHRTAEFALTSHQNEPTLGCI
jgi:hypothetical protein